MHQYLFTAALSVVSLGLSLLLAVPAAAAESVLVELGETWKYWKGSSPPSDPPAAWRDLGFDDGTWLEGPSGIGYGDSDDATILDDMQNGYLSLFTRRSFDVADPSQLTNLIFSVDYDDGFVAFLNGVEVARRNMGAPQEEFAFDRVADSAHEAGTPEFLDLSGSLALLLAGRNILAIQVHNWALTSSDLTLRPRLLGNSLVLVAPIGLTCTLRDLDSDGRGDQIELAWRNRASYDSIRIARNGAVLGSPLAGDATSFVDTAIEPFLDVYEVVATFGGEDCAPLSCAVAVCAPANLSCSLALADGKTAASLSWTPDPETQSIDVVREGTLLATLEGTATGYLDPDVESIEPEDDTDFQVVFRHGSGTCTAACGPISLCPEPMCYAVEVAGETKVRLEWGNPVKVWESFTILRDGAEIASGIPGDAISYLDETLVPAVGTSVTYTLHPVAPAGRQAACDRICRITPISERPFQAPEGGWDYIFDVESHPSVPHDLHTPERGIPGNLDGAWIRAAGDSWDGSEPGDTGAPPDGPRPGGIRVVEIAAEGPCGEDLKALEVVDPGDPTGYPEPNNRLILLGVDAGASTENLLRSGITFAARWRLTPSPIETQNPGPNGDGQSLVDGLGHVGVYFRNDGSPELAAAGATAGYAISLNSLNGMEFGTATPVTLTLLEGTEWRSVWVTISDTDADGAYDIRVYLNGSTAPLTPDGTTISGDGLSLPTAAPDLRPGVANSLAIGLPGAVDDGSVQFDYVAFKRGVHAPSSEACATPNRPPTARISITPASGEVILSGGTATVELDGSLSDDGDGGTQGLTFLWEVTLGPEPVVLTNPTAQSTQAVFTDEGTYEIELTVDDGQAARNVDTVKVMVVVTAENRPPVVRIAVDPPTGVVTLSEGSASVTLDGSGSDNGEGGTQGLSFAWRVVSAPAAVSLDAPAAAVTRATFTTAGQYVIELVVDDGQTPPARADVQISVRDPQVVYGFKRGDWNDDGTINITDAVNVLGYLFLGGAANGCTDAADLDDGGSLDISDPIGILLWLFQGGTEPAPPGPWACGPDPTADDLDDCLRVCQ